ncbi:hypothetical protein [Bradyrhizobium sp. NAS80.1]|uniref:hypothetical protein n=1 Tax=Bradyrhizobium sp. NAS80.1 TaxID=1680159 RepID=UPI000A05DC3F|nr:hypothetical protein [Bradyrhizobium sp. NAS80.1]
MVEIGGSPRQIGWPIPPTSTSYRVIGTDGFERDMSDRADWITAMKSGAVEAQSLFLDRETLRWRPVSELAIFIEAEQAVATDGVGGRQPESGPAATQESAPAFENAPKRAPGTTFLWVALVTVVVIVLAAWAAGSTLPANVQVIARQVPEPVRIGAAAVLFVILSEEFYWFVSTLVGIRSVRPARRFALQVLALLTTCVLLYAVFALFSTGGFRLDAGFLVRNAVVVGLAYAASLFFWSIALLAGTSATLARKLLASAMASAMLAGTVYMGLVPIVRHGGAAPNSFCSSCTHRNSQPG